MGISILPNRYRVNGVVSTDKTVLQNMETLAGAAQAYINYDITDGKWAVVINTTGNAVASFNDSNILGGVSVQGTGLRDLYNSVRVEFPHVDLRDEPDFVEVTIPVGDRNSNEPDNQLIMQLDVVNDPVMAEMLGLIELKQSRVDRVIRFTADRSYIGLRAGDLIDVTNAMLAYTNKVFRIISISEVDGDDGSIAVEITALEYDANVYDTSDLFRFERTNENGIVTIGSIDPPDAPTITAIDRDSRPRVILETTAPAGIVEGMEFWFSTDAGNYTQVGTQVKVGGGTFAFGDTISFDFDQVVTGDIYAKCRAINSTTSSEFGNVGNLIGFVKTQQTDAITENTEFVDNSTGNLLIANGLLALLGGLDGILSGNTTSGSAAGNLIETIGSESTPALSLTVISANVQAKLNNVGNTYTQADGYDYPIVIGNAIQFRFTLNNNLRAMQMTATTPTGNLSYEFLEPVTNTVQTNYIFAQPAFEIVLKFGSAGNFYAGTTVTNSTIDWTTKTSTFTVENPVLGQYDLFMVAIPTFDLNMVWSRVNLTSSGDTNKVFFTSFGNVGPAQLALTGFR